MSAPSKTNALGVGAEGVLEISAEQLTPVNDYLALGLTSQLHRINANGGVE